ncbi:hypothetical protein F4825DRAFT_41683 [Nemania diffusa]|nr:hypothetical protein F4825DRAFT_41683 [Nemania diffusa]
MLIIISIIPSAPYVYLCMLGMISAEALHIRLIRQRHTIVTSSIRHATECSGRVCDCILCKNLIFETPISHFSQIPNYRVATMCSPTYSQCSYGCYLLRRQLPGTTYIPIPSKCGLSFCSLDPFPTFNLCSQRIGLRGQKDVVLEMKVCSRNRQAKYCSGLINPPAPSHYSSHLPPSQ